MPKKKDIAAHNLVSQIRTLSSSLHPNSDHPKHDLSGHSNSHARIHLANEISAAKEALKHVPPEIFTHVKGHDEGAFYKFVKQKARSTAWMVAVRLLMLPVFDYTMGMIIIGNLVLMVAEADQSVEQKSTSEHGWDTLKVLGLVALIAFILEMCLRLFVFRNWFFKDPWNLFDFCVVVTDTLVSFVGFFAGDAFSVSVLRIFRLVKLTRVSKMMRVFPELRLLMAGLLGSVSAILWGTILLLLFLLVWSIVAVLVLEPLNKDIAYGTCSRCSSAYSSVGQSMLTLWQIIVMGDAWGDLTMPMVDMYPATICFFLPLFVSVGMAVVNLIAGVVVAVAMQAKEDIHEEDALSEKVEKLENKTHLFDLCRAMDTETTGELNADKFWKAFQEPGEFRESILGLNITADDLRIVWTIIDPERCGCASYMDFLNHCYALKNSDSEFMLSYIKYYITEIRNYLWEKMQMLHAEEMSLEQRQLAQFKKMEEEQEEQLDEIRKIEQEEHQIETEESQIENALVQQLQAKQAAAMPTKQSTAPQELKEKIDNRPKANTDLSSSKDIMDYLDAHCMAVKASMDRTEGIVAAASRLLEVKVSSMEDTLHKEFAKMSHPTLQDNARSSAEPAASQAVNVLGHESLDLAALRSKLCGNEAMITKLCSQVRHLEELNAILVQQAKSESGGQSEVRYAAEGLMPAGILNTYHAEDVLQSSCEGKEIVLALRQENAQLREAFKYQNAGRDEPKDHQARIRSRTDFVSKDSSAQDEASAEKGVREFSI